MHILPMQSLAISGGTTQEHLEKMQCAKSLCAELKFNARSWNNPFFDAQNANITPLPRHRAENTPALYKLYLKAPFG